MCPTRRFPASVRATIDGVVLYPPRLGMTTGLSFSTRATHEFVVPRSMPITRSMNDPLVGSPPTSGASSARLSYHLGALSDAPAPALVWRRGGVQRQYTLR